MTVLDDRIASVVEQADRVCLLRASAAEHAPSDERSGVRLLVDAGDSVFVDVVLANSLDGQGATLQVQLAGLQNQQGLHVNQVEILDRLMIICLLLLLLVHLSWCLERQALLGRKLMQLRILLLPVG